MPIITAQIWPGRTAEAKERLIQALTDAIVEAIGAHREAVTVVIEEIPKENWGIGGVPAPRMFP